MQNDIPDWLAAFATDVSERIGNCNAKAQFQDTVREWAKTYDPHKYLIPIRREYRFTLADKYALLSAVRDCVHCSAEPIGPDSWGPLPEGDNKALKAVLAYAGLCSHVPELKEANLPDLKLCLADVEADLKVPARAHPYIASLLIIAWIVIEVVIYATTWPGTAWIRNHPHSLGLQLSFAFIVVLIALGLYVPTWRKWCWWGSIGGIIIGVLQII